MIRRKIEKVRKIKPRPKSKLVEMSKKSIVKSKPKFIKHYKARVIPELSRRDPNNFPPEITEEDINEGMLKMLYKGMIPHDADLSPAFQRHKPPLEFKKATLFSSNNLLPSLTTR